MADESIQQQVNDAILQAGKIENRLSRMAVLMSSPVPLTVTYSATLADDVLSVAILSSGALETERAGGGQYRPAHGAGNHLWRPVHRRGRSARENGGDHRG